MKDITSKTANELAGLLQGWDARDLPTTPFTLHRSNESDHPGGETDFAISKSNIEAAIASGKVSLPGDLTVDDLSSRLRVGKTVVSPILGPSDENGNPSVDFGSVANLRYAAAEANKAKNLPNLRGLW